MIIQANVENAPELAKIVVDDWKIAYKGMVDEEYLNSLTYEDQTKKRAKSLSEEPQTGESTYMYIDENTNEVLGFMVVGKDYESSLKADMEIQALYVDPSHRYRGIGSKLVCFAKEEMKKNNYESLSIWCLKKNFPARKFYEKMDGKIVEEKDFAVGNQMLKKVCFKYFSEREKDKSLSDRIQLTDIEEIFANNRNDILTSDI